MLWSEEWLQPTQMQRLHGGHGCWFLVRVSPAHQPALRQPLIDMWTSSPSKTARLEREKHKSHRGYVFCGETVHSQEGSLTSRPTIQGFVFFLIITIIISQSWDKSPGWRKQSYSWVPSWAVSFIWSASSHLSIWSRANTKVFILVMVQWFQLAWTLGSLSIKALGWQSSSFNFCDCTFGKTDTYATHLLTY